MVEIDIIGDIGAINPSIDASDIAVKIEILELNSFEVRNISINLKEVTLTETIFPSANTKQFLAGIEADLKKLITIGSCVPIFT